MCNRDWADFLWVLYLMNLLALRWLTFVRGFATNIENTVCTALLHNHQKETSLRFLSHWAQWGISPRKNIFNLAPLPATLLAIFAFCTKCQNRTLFVKLFTLACFHVPWASSFLFLASQKRVFCAQYPWKSSRADFLGLFYGEIVTRQPGFIVQHYVQHQIKLSICQLDVAWQKQLFCHFF